MATATPDRIKLEPTWKAQLGDQFAQPYMQRLREFLQAEKQAGKVIYPPGDQFFAAFNACPFDRVKVVILGQDPYHGPGQAHGLCFSVSPGVPFPPSLRNIFKEINAELGVPIPNNGCLQHWAEQGVLLLNSVLTVEQGRAASHQGKGWETFTDQVIRRLNTERKGLVFLLWGSYAQKKAQFVDRDRHHVLASAHPSPLSAQRGFMGNGHFKQTNAFLVAQGDSPIDWSVPDQ